MKNLFITCLFFFGMTTVVKAQDTIIEHKDFTLQISKVTERTKSSEYLKTGENFEVFEYEWTNRDIRGIIEDWMAFMTLETIEYNIEYNVSEREQFLKSINTEEFIKDLPKKDSINFSGYFKDRDVVSVFMAYNVEYKVNTTDKERTKAIHKQAFEVFCNAMNLEIKVELQPVTYWKLEIIDAANASISYDQNTHWKRTDTEEYIYYERIKYRRIADLLSRKLDVFVKPIPYNAQKFDIRMPYSDDIFDLKYSMIDHGLELTEVTEEMEIMNIRAKAGNR